ncbi:MAG: hypothetical protein BJ554DRAFT_1342 [Olpidium bornovanus]|uniref:Uncharacterized protein n=1 Tax=Olpidium bornovanus TaxID=278681 RepID=A0A8H7ZSL8_9FUNG|nr:MAG: hypothetical protein BJ554DRAFT_1342 [Olpidium bornovanus]
MAGKRSREEEEERQNNGAGGAEEKGDVHGGRPDGEEVVADSKPEAAQAVTKEKESGDQEEENADDQQVRGFGEYLPSQIQDAEAVAAEDSTRAHDGKTVAVDGGCDPRAAKVLRTGGPLDAEETARAKTESAHHVRNVSPRSEHEDVTKGRDEQTPDPAAWSTHPGEDSGNLAFLEAPSTPAPGTQQSPAQSPAVEKRKRVGRPPKDPPPSWVEDGGILDEQEEEIFGKVDPLGEKKITKDGQLLGGTWEESVLFCSSLLGDNRATAGFLNWTSLMQSSHSRARRSNAPMSILCPRISSRRPVTQRVSISLLLTWPKFSGTATATSSSSVIKHGRKGADDYYETQLLGTAEWGKPIEPQRLIATAAPPQRMTETPDDASAKQDGGEPPLGSIDRFVVESAVEQIGPTEPAGVLELASRPADILLSRGYVIQQRRHPPIEGQVWEEGGRPIGFWDWHTNMEQVPVSTQATGLRVVISDRGRTHVFASPGTSSALDEQLRHAELSQVFHGSIPPSPLVSNFGGWQDDDATRSLYPIQIMDRQWCGYLPL